MSNLQNETPANTYKDLFRLVNSGLGLDATLRNISGGDGTPTGLYISTLQLQADMNGGILRRATSRDQRALYVNMGDVTSVETPAGTVGIDLESADIFKIGLDSNITMFNLSNPPEGISASDGRSRQITLIVEQKTTGTPGWANITWGSSVLWPSATIPSITEVIGAIDVFRFTYVDDGSISYWFGEIVGQDMRTS
jgi:hypothetical protein